MITTLLKRDLLLARRQAAGVGLSIGFMALFVMLCGIALGGSRPELGPGLIWLAATLSALLGLDRLFDEDHRTGTLAQLHLAGISGLSITIAKMLTFAITALLPLIIIAPFLALLFEMDGPVISGTLLSLLIGVPALSAYATLTAALLCAQRGSASLLGIILTAPFLVPILIFGVEAAQAYPAEGLTALQFRILGGLSFIALALGLPATMAALAANRGPS